MDISTSIVQRIINLEFIAILLGAYISYWTLSKVYAIFIYPYYVSPLRNLPGPKDGHFLLGQAINEFTSGNPNEPFTSWMQKWPTAHFIRYLTYFNADALLVTSLAAQKEVLGKHCYSFAKPTVYFKLASEIVGAGLGTAEGQEHKEQRKVLNGLFSLINLKKYIPVFRRKSRELVALFDKAIDEDDGYITLTPTFSKLTLDIMGVFALGIELNNLDSPTVFEHCYKELFEQPVAGQILIAINAFFPIRWLPIKVNRDFLHAKETVRSQLRTIVKERIADIREGRASVRKSATEADDLLTYLVREKWKEDEILEQMITFTAAGHETTAIHLVWATHILSAHPDVAARLRKEAQDLLATTPNPGYHELESLPYMEKFSKEVSRFISSAVLIPRQAVEDVTILGVFIPKGTIVMTMPAMFHHNPTIWGEDCGEFNPDRWDRISEKIADPYALAAFSQGPRMCIGRAMAVTQFKAIMVELVSRFEFECLETGRIELMNPNLLLRPKSGLKVRARRVS
ncbi:putative cytochrome p450 protein [Podospora aff. communis PSN243]|uniref:Cytochrome p450 protein n=1 Tax=Podospora aff. communis PSN243 TaxID=3040156 RepID=A0AAV9G959_9PEZI|nr:putative cytochrome p450 protein [Podospora aff. communis PSN243]